VGFCDYRNDSHYGTVGTPRHDLARRSAVAGSGLRLTPVPQIARELEPWTLCALGVTVVTGACLFLSEAVRLSISEPFFYKMILFTLAILIHFTIHWKASMRGESQGAWFGKIAACLSLCSWLGVAMAGRAIAFL